MLCEPFRQLMRERISKRDALSNCVGIAQRQVPDDWRVSAAVSCGARRRAGDQRQNQ